MLEAAEISKRWSESADWARRALVSPQAMQEWKTLASSREAGSSLMAAGALAALAETDEARAESMLRSSPSPLLWSALFLGVMKGAWAESKTYLQSRRQGGRSVWGWSDVRRRGLEIEDEIRLLELALMQAASHENGEGSLLREFLRRAPSSVSRALELMGGAGYMDDHGLARRFRAVHAWLAENGPVGRPSA